MYIDNQPSYENKTSQYTVKYMAFLLSQKIALCWQKKPSVSSEMTNAIQFIHSEMSSTFLAVSGY